jgi:hypothetical protein
LNIVNTNSKLRHSGNKKKLDLKKIRSVIDAGYEIYHQIISILITSSIKIHDKSDAIITQNVKLILRDDSFHLPLPFFHRPAIQ